MDIRPINKFYIRPLDIIDIRFVDEIYIRPIDITDIRSVDITDIRLIVNPLECRYIFSLRQETFVFENNRKYSPSVYVHTKLKMDLNSILELTLYEYQ